MLSNTSLLPMIQHFSADMLMARLRTMFACAHDKQLLRVLKCVNITIHNLKTAKTHGMCQRDVDRYIAMLYYVGTYVNQMNIMGIKYILFVLYSELDYKTISARNIPNTVRMCFEAVIDD
jgi:predicted type IV restriction endonuclease